MEQQLIRQVKFPLKLKFVLTTIIVLALSLGCYVLLATDLLRKDKTAYIFDAILLRTEQQAAQLEAYLVKSQQSPQSDVQALLTKEQREELLSQVNRKAAYKTEIISFDGHPLLNPTENLSQAHPFWSILRSSINQGVQEFNGTDEVIGFTKLPRWRLVVLARIPRSEAHSTANWLVNRSLWFGGLVMGLAIIVGILFARPLTSQLERLFDLTQRLASGDFTQRVHVTSHDEVGSLGDSFNFMSEKIVQYMEEMKEKNRLENELKIAQLVQESFFPPTELNLHGVSVEAFYAPATECGGDWWGHLEFPDTTVLFIADATGHGVPAALLTAAINCSKNNLKHLAELDPAYQKSASKIMSFLNSSVCQSGHHILMTCFVAVIDHHNGQLRYTNASHNPPLVYRQPIGREPTKDDLRPLLEANGDRLGHDPSALYNESSVEFLPGDRIVLYTDGVTDATDPTGTAWGQRRFVKKLLAVFGSQEGAREVVAELLNFRQAPDWADDVTLVIARMNQ